MRRPSYSARSGNDAWPSDAPAGSKRRPDGTLSVAKNANESLADAQPACAGFLIAAPEFAVANPDLGFAEDQLTE